MSIQYALKKSTHRIYFKVSNLVIMSYVQFL